MIKLNVFDMEGFLQTVNECVGAVKIICPDGRKQDINKQDKIQFDLRRRHSDNRDCLVLALEVTNPKDYFKIVYFTVWDC